jgi:hypothetical protein
MIVIYLINRISSRILRMKTPCEILLGSSIFIVPPMMIEYKYFVRDHKSAVGKLDPRAVKCIFIGYSSCQKVISISVLLSGNYLLAWM